MGDVKITANTPVQAASKTQAQPQKADSVIGRHLDTLKKAVFSEIGSSVLAGAAAGALIGGIPGAGVGAFVGLGLAAGIKGGDTSAIFAGTVAVGAAAVAFPPVGALLVGASAVSFATGAAQKAAGKIGEFLTQHGPQEQPAAAK